MAGRRKKPKLRIDGVYYTTKIYTPEGKRTSISFGHVDDRIEAEVRAVFAKWSELYERHPKKVLSYKNPYEAVEHIVSPSSVCNVRDLMHRYLQWASNTMRQTRDGLESPDMAKVRRAIKFLNPYSDWPIADFGPDELRKVQKALLDTEYKSGKTMKRYTRRGINDTINCIRSARRWGMGRGVVKIENVEVLKEVKPLRAYPNNPLYPQGKPDACVVGQNRSQRGENHAWRAFLACRLGLELFARPHNDPVIRISS